MDVTTAAGSLRRDIRVMTLISGAHSFSHFYQLVLPPLFPLLKAEFDVSYTTLGLLAGLLYVASGIAQPAAGFLVDRFGARRVLISGLALFAGAIACAGLVPSFWMLLPIAVAAGIGNSVFHPADFAILNASVHPTRLGRAYGIHGIFGNIGWAAAPVASLTLASMFGWRMALVMLGSLGLAATVYLASQRDAMSDHRDRAAHKNAPPTTLAEDIRMLTATPILLSFGFFAFTSMAILAVQTFVPPALTALHLVPLSLAAASLTAFMLGGVVGTLGGGILADRTRRRELVVAVGLLLFSLIFLVLTLPELPHIAILPLFALAGGLLGSTTPSRDMLIRESTPLGAAGKVYGFVYSGLDLGAAIMPPLAGWLLDSGEPRMIFVAVSVVAAASIVLVLMIRRQPVAAAAE